MNKVSHALKHILEIIWLVVGLITLGIALFETYKSSYREAIPFYIFSAIALFFYISRRNERSKQKL